MKRSRLKPKGKRGTSYTHEYKLATEQVKQRSGGMCEIQASHHCDGRAQEYPHHRKLRSQGGSNSPDNLIDTCWTGHQWIHQELSPNRAYLLQLLIPRDTPEYPYDP